MKIRTVQLMGKDQGQLSISIHHCFLSVSAENGPAITHLWSPLAEFEKHVWALSEFEKHVWAPSSNQFWMGEEQDRETRGNTQARASPPVNESFPATHPQYDEFVNQSMSLPGSLHRPVDILEFLFSFSQNVYWDPNQPAISHLSETQKCFSIQYC